MSPAELDAVLESDVSALETRLYSYLRRHMDYATGLVGARRRISYQSIREHIEYTPPRGSKDPAYKPSNDQIKRLLRKLENRGLIERKHTNHLKESMVFKLVLATTDLNRPNEDRQGSAMRAAPRGAPTGSPVNTRDSNDMSAMMTAEGAPWDERHTSVTSDYKDLSLTRASNSEGSAAGMDLTFTKDFIQLAKLTGLDKTPDQIQGMFEAFRYHQKHRNTIRPHSDWLAEWRVWCGREKSYGQAKTSRSSGAGQSNRPENPTAKLLRESKEAAAELARTGYYDSGSEFDEDS